MIEHRKTISATILASLILALVGCGAKEERKLTVKSVSPDGKYEASIFETKDPGGAFGGTGYVGFIRETTAPASEGDGQEVFSGENGNKVGLNWENDRELFIEFCGGRDILSAARYVKRPNGVSDSNDLTVIIQDVRSHLITPSGRVFCAK